MTLKTSFICPLVTVDSEIVYCFQLLVLSILWYIFFYLLFSSDHQKLEREARICRLLKHPNIGLTLISDYLQWYFTELHDVFRMKLCFLFPLFY